jgi:CheY-like chemotaxis protein
MPRALPGAPIHAHAKEQSEISGELTQRTTTPIIAQAGHRGFAGNSGTGSALHTSATGWPQDQSFNLINVLADKKAHGANRYCAGSMHNELLNGLMPKVSDRDPLHPEPSPQTILLVDDDPDIRSLTRTFLQHEGYRVHSCGDSERASQIFRSAIKNTHGIDLLITDYYMPDRSGMELALELKALRHQLPVLLISGGFLGAKYLQQLRTEGWNFLGKPFALPDLLAAVHLILGNSRVVA